MKHEQSIQGMEESTTGSTALAGWPTTETALHPEELQDGEKAVAKTREVEAKDHQQRNERCRKAD